MGDNDDGNFEFVSELNAGGGGTYDEVIDEEFTLQDELSSLRKKAKNKRKFEKLKRSNDESDGKGSESDEDINEGSDNELNVQSLIRDLHKRTKCLQRQQQLLLFNHFQTKDKETGNARISLVADQFIMPPPSSSLAAIKTDENDRSTSLLIHSIGSHISDYKVRFKTVYEEMGCPHVIVCCISATRANNVIKSLSKTFKCPIAKLFSKHFTVEEQRKMLASRHYPICVGTPNRLSKLLELGSLCMTEHTSLLVMDGYKDPKTFTVMSLNGVKEDLFNMIEKYAVSEFSHLKLAVVPATLNESERQSQSRENGNSSSNKGGKKTEHNLSNKSNKKRKQIKNDK